MILSISTTAFATPNQPQKAQITQESIERMIAQQEGNSDVEIQVSPGAVAVFVLGILARYDLHWADAGGCAYAQRGLQD